MSRFRIQQQLVAPFWNIRGLAIRAYQKQFQIYFHSQTYIGDLNTGLVWYSNGRKLSGLNLSRYSDQHLNTRIFKWWSEYRTTIWITDIWIPDKWKFGIQMLFIQIPTVFSMIWVNVKIIRFFFVSVMSTRLTRPNWRAKKWTPSQTCSVPSNSSATRWMFNLLLVLKLLTDKKYVLKCHCPWAKNACEDFSRCPPNMFVWF